MKNLIVTLIILLLTTAVTVSAHEHRSRFRASHRITRSHLHARFHKTEMLAGRYHRHHHHHGGHRHRAIARGR